MSASISIDLQFVPRKWQQECIDNQTRFSVWALHRRAGKTTLAINLIEQYCLSKPGRYLYIAPTLKQAREIAWQTCKDAVKAFMKVDVGGSKRDLVEIYESDFSIRFWNGSVIKLAGTDNPDALRGMKLAGAVLDEVAQMPREVWSEVVQPALLDSRGWAIFIGTPKGINLFSELFARGQDPSFKPDWSSARYTCYETEALAPDQIEQMKRDLSPEAFAREMLCDFSASATDQLISIGDIEAAVNRQVPPDAYIRFEAVMGVDVARYGDDSSCIVIRRGYKIENIIKFHGLDLVTLSEQIAKIAHNSGVSTIYVDGTGLGGGVPDILRSMGMHPFDINFGQKSSESLYANKRSEMWCKLGQWIRGGGSIPQDQQLMKELAAPTYEKLDDGKIKLENKKQMKERIGFSPDMADALALTFCNWTPEVKPSEELELLKFWQPPRLETNPLARFETQVKHANRPSRRFGSSIVQRRLC